MTREEAIEILGCIYMEFSTDEDKEAVDMGIKALKERPHGEWVKKNTEFGGICWATCSVCKKISNGEGQDNGFGHDYTYPNFCPNCGADMSKECDNK